MAARAHVHQVAELRIVRGAQRVDRLVRDGREPAHPADHDRIPLGEPRAHGRVDLSRVAEQPRVGREVERREQAGGQARVRGGARRARREVHVHQPAIPERARSVA